MKPRTRIAGLAYAHSRLLAAVLGVVLLGDLILLGQQGAPPAGTSGDARGAIAIGDDSPANGAGTGPGVIPSARATSAGAQRGEPFVSRLAPGSKIAGGTVPFGIDGDELTVVYYWKGDQTKASPFLKGTGVEGNVDEGLAFKTLVRWINANADGGDMMGFRFNMHGWKLKPIVVEAGKGDDQIRAAERIASEIKPFAAISSHGSVSAYVCPRLAEAGLMNLSTYDLDWGLLERTNGYCLPQGLSWDAQVDLTIAYLKAEVEREPDRRYGLLYASYPGLVRSGPTLYDRLIDAGIPMVAKASVDTDPTTAGREQPGVITSFQAAGVNTIIAPESGSLLTFTHAAQAAEWHPNYYVWPCSGQDSLGMVRLYNANQWRKAAGLTCYDQQLNADLTNDENARKTEWYKAYRQIEDGEPPAPTALVYQSLLPLVAGITHAGKTLTIERFRAGQAAVNPYRYDAIDGRVSDPTNLLVSLNAQDGSQIGDAAKVYWDETRTTPGNAMPGTYSFPERRRYKRGARF